MQRKAKTIRFKIRVMIFMARTVGALFKTLVSIQILARGYALKIIAGLQVFSLEKSERSWP